MRLASLLLLVPLAQGQTTFAQSVQRVAGLEIQYLFPFREDKALSQRAFAVAKAANDQTRSVEAFEAPTLIKSGTFQIVKTVYQSPQTQSIEELFAKAFRYVTDSGAKVINKSFEPILMTGYECGRLSFEADQANWRLGGEMMLIIDRRSGTQWHLQFVFGKQRISSFVLPDLDSDRRHARNVLATVKVRDL